MGLWLYILGANLESLCHGDISVMSDWQIQEMVRDIFVEIPFTVNLFIFVAIDFQILPMESNFTFANICRSISWSY